MARVGVEARSLRLRERRRAEAVLDPFIGRGAFLVEVLERSGGGPARWPRQLHTCISRHQEKIFFEFVRARVYGGKFLESSVA